MLAQRPLASLSDVLANMRVVSVPMRVKFRGVNHRESVLLEGPAGWAEFAPFLEYGDHEAANWLASALEAAWQGYPTALRTSIPLNATVPAVAPSQVESVLANYDGEIHEVKVKIAERGESIADDVARVAAVRELLPDAGIKVDANMGYSHSQAVEALTRLAPYSLLYAEQPAATVEGLARVRATLQDAGVRVPIAADESVRKAEDPLLVARAGAADLLVIKAAPLGGVRKALDIVQLSGLPCVVSSALETSVGIATGVALAAALPQLPYGCGLGTVSLMTADVTRQSLVATDGQIPVRAVTPEPDLLDALSAQPERIAWWEQRVRRCYEVLEARGRRR